VAAGAASGHASAARCRPPGRCARQGFTVGLRGLRRRDQRGVQRWARLAGAAELARDHRRQAQAAALGHGLGNALVVHLAEHLVLAGEQRIAEAGRAHALDQHLRELAFELARDLVDLRRVVAGDRVEFQ